MRRKLVLLLIFVSLVIIGLVALSFFQSLHFRLVKTDPANGRRDVPITQSVTFYFNREMAASSNQEDAAVDSDSGQSFDNVVAVSPAIGGQVKTEGKKITFKPNPLSLTPQTYTFTLSHIKSKQGETLPDVKFSFTVSYIDFNNLPSDQRQQQINQTDQYHDANTPRNKFIASLPYTTDNYSIEYINDGDYFLIRITNTPVNTYKKSALNYITSQGLDPGKEHIEYFVLRGLE